MAQQFKFGLTALLIFLGVAACTRKVDPPSRLSFQIENSVRGKSVSALSASLTRLMVNVTKPGSSPFIFVSDAQESGAAISSSVEMNVESGPDQLIQVLAIYEESGSSAMAFYYDERVVTLNPGENVLNLTLASLGGSSGVQGRVVGRYALPGPVYPTAKLEMVYDPGVGKNKMVISEAEVVGGWFNLFLLDDVRMSYRFKDSKQLLEFTTNFDGTNRTTSTNVKLADFSAVNHSPGLFPGIGIVDRSSYTALYRTHTPSGVGDFEYVNPFKIVYGYHGSNDLPWTGLYVKFYDTLSTNFSKLKSLAKDGGDPDCTNVTLGQTITVSEVTASPLLLDGAIPCSINVTPVSYMSAISGGTTFSPPLSTAWTSNYIEVTRSFLDGAGNDNVAPFRGMLRVQDPVMSAYTSVEPGSGCSGGCTHPFDIQLVDGVDPVIDIIRIYKSSTVTAEEARGNGDDVNCQKIAADSRFSVIGTIDVTSGTSTYTGNSIPFAGSDVNSDHPVAICPVGSSGQFLPGAVLIEARQLFN